MVEPNRDAHGTDNPEVAYERQDVSFRGVVSFAAAMIIAAVAIQFLLWLMFQAMLRTEHPARKSRSEQANSNRVTIRDGRLQGRLPEAPQLEGLIPGNEPRQRDSANRAGLDDYQWVDRNSGVIRIPVQQAMRLLVDRASSAASTHSQPPRSGWRRGQETPTDANSGRPTRRR